MPEIVIFGNEVALDFDAGDWVRKIMTSDKVVEVSSGMLAALESVRETQGWLFPPLQDQLRSLYDA